MLNPFSVSKMSGRMTRGISFLKVVMALNFDQFRGFALIEPSRDPFGLFAFDTFSIEQINCAIELQQNATELFPIPSPILSRAQMEQGKCAILVRRISHRQAFVSNKLSRVVEDDIV